MPSRQDRCEKTARELFLEHAAAYFDDLKATAANAPHGQIFNHAEAFAFEKGRELLQQSLKGMLQEQIDEFEKEKETTLCQKCQQKKRHLGYSEQWKKYWKQAK